MNSRELIEQTQVTITNVLMKIQGRTHSLGNLPLFSVEDINHITSLVEKWGEVLLSQDELTKTSNPPNPYTREG